MSAKENIDVLVVIIPLPVPNAFCSEEQGVVQIIISFAPVRKRFARVENERQVQAKIVSTLLESQKGFDIVCQRPPCIFIPNKIKAGNQIRKLLLQGDTVIQVPHDFLWRKVTVDSVYNLSTCLLSRLMNGAMYVHPPWHQ